MLRNVEKKLLVGMHCENHECVLNEGVPRSQVFTGKGWRVDEVRGDPDALSGEDR